jgi:hypothetical protein
MHEWQKPILEGDPSYSKTGVGSIDLLGITVYQWVDASITFTDGSSVSFSGSDWALSLIIGDGIGVGSILVPLNQFPPSGYVRVAAYAEEAGGVEVFMYNNGGNLLGTVIAVIDGIGIDVPLTVYGNYTVVQ